MVANGFGYSIANIRFGSDEAPDGTSLATVPIDPPFRPMRMGLILPRGPARRAVRAFADHCRQTVTADHLPGLTAGQPT